MVKPLITVGLTAFNEGKWLQEAWDSVTNQTDSRWEAIIVLDGGASKSTTKTFDSISHPKLEKIKLEKNIGPYLTRTKAIQNAKTQWYYQLDGDDLLPGNALEIIIKIIEKQPKIDFVFGKVQHFRKKIEKTTSGFWNLEELSKSPTIDCHTPFRVELFEKIGGFATDLKWGGADWDFWIGMAEIQAQGQKTEEVIYKRRRRKNNVGSNWPYSREEVANTIISRHLRFFENNVRKEQCLGHAYEFMARNFGSKGNRKAAFEYAVKSINYGFKNKRLDEIVKEYEMPKWRYFMRRAGRIISIIIKIFKPKNYSYSK